MSGSLEGRDALIYLEPDDEITSLVRRLRAADAERVIVVAPGRSRATSSTVALRLLSRVAGEEGRTLAVVGDSLTRSLAADAGLAAFATVEDARAGHDQPSVPPAPATHAEIRVLRAGAADETLAGAVAAAASLADSPGSDPATSPSDETVPIPVPRPERRAGPSPPPPGTVRRRGTRVARRRALPVAAAVALGALVVAGVAAGVVLLPAATVTIAPRVEQRTATYELVVTDPERATGTVEATVPVTATGTYRVLEPATGTVTFRNFNPAVIEVPAGTLVAAGEQAFETIEPVAVPSGALTPDGRIAAGEADAPVVAAAPGPAGNVPAGAIDTVLSQGIAARLRVFPQNTTRLVINAEPTSGGVDESGPEITEADVAAAVEALRAELARLADEARPDLGGLHLVDVPTREPETEVPEDLVGARDVPEAELSGSLAWEVVGVDEAALRAMAEERFAADPAVVPDGFQLVPESITVALGAPVLDGERVVAGAEVRGAVAPALDPAAVVERIRGRSEPDAEQALAELGIVDVELWPGWASSVPSLDWRIEVRIVEPSG